MTSGLPPERSTDSGRHPDFGRRVEMTCSGLATLWWRILADATLCTRAPCRHRSGTSCHVH
eukprot:3957562-Amphidinium_carterae.2